MACCICSRLPRPLDQGQDSCPSCARALLTARSLPFLTTRLLSVGCQDSATVVYPTKAEVSSSVWGFGFEFCGKAAKAGSNRELPGAELTRSDRNTSEASAPPLPRHPRTAVRLATLQHQTHKLQSNTRRGHFLLLSALTVTRSSDQATGLR